MNYNMYLQVLTKNQFNSTTLHSVYNRTIDTNTNRPIRNWFHPWKRESSVEKKAMNPRTDAVASGRVDVFNVTWIRETVSNIYPANIGTLHTILQIFPSGCIKCNVCAWRGDTYRHPKTLHIYFAPRYNKHPYAFINCIGSGVCERLCAVINK